MLFKPFTGLKLSIKVDEPTPSGRIYPKHVLLNAIKERIDEKNLLIAPVASADGTIDISTVIGVINSMEYDEATNEIVLAGKSCYGEDMSLFNVFPNGLGSVRDGKVQADFKLISFSVEDVGENANF
jgi:hypothetical protein